MPIWRFCGGSPRTQGGGGLSKSTLLIILGTLTQLKCVTDPPHPARIARINASPLHPRASSGLPNNTPPTLSARAGGVCGPAKWALRRERNWVGEAKARAASGTKRGRAGRSGEPLHSLRRGRISAGEVARGRSYPRR